jgi:hypothetical protein
MQAVMSAASAVVVMAADFRQAAISVRSGAVSEQT